jgi:hypothetical protein
MLVFWGVMTSGFVVRNISKKYTTSLFRPVGLKLSYLPTSPHGLQPKRPTQTSSMERVLHIPVTESYEPNFNQIANKTLLVVTIITTRIKVTQQHAA